MLVDLHSHTTASDGSLTPQEMLWRADNKQLDMLAITDHDTTAGVQEAISLESRVKIISGVEISTGWHAFDIHVVGLNFDLKHQGMQQALIEQRHKREERALEMGRRLAKAGIEDIYSDAKRLAKQAPVTRAHFARALVNRGVVDSFNKVFDKYLRRGNIGYVPNNWMSIDDAIKHIHDAGGKAVLAHPSHYQLSNKWLRKLVAEFAAAGGDALEVAIPQLSPDVVKFLAQLAEDHNLSASQGSDFHQPSPWRELGRGLHLPDNSRALWLDF